MRPALGLLFALGGCSACDKDYDIPPPSGVIVSAGPTAATTPPTTAAEACNVLAVNEAEMLLGSPAQPGIGDSSTCVFQGTTSGSVTVMFAREGADQIWSSIPREEAVQVAIDGVDAYRMTALPVFMMRRQSSFVMVTATGSDIPGDRVETVMRGVASRLPP